MESSFDLERFRITRITSDQSTPSRKPPRICRKDFLKGPIPWDWLQQAAVLKGRSLIVGLIAWREAGIVQRMTVSLRPARYRQCGVSQPAAARAVRNLESAGLVRVIRRPGRCLELTILVASEP